MLRRLWGTLSRRSGDLLYVSIRSSFWQAVAAAALGGRRWVRTFKRRFGISGRRLPLDEPVSADHVQAKAGPGPIFGTFFWPLSRRILFEMTQILEPFWFLFLGRELYQVTAFYHLLDDLAAQVGPEKMHVLAECRWNKS